MNWDLCPLCSEIESNIEAAFGSLARKLSSRDVSTQDSEAEDSSE